MDKKIFNDTLTCVKVLYYSFCTHETLPLISAICESHGNKMDVVRVPLPPYPREERFVFRKM